MLNISMVSLNILMLTSSSPFYTITNSKLNFRHCLFHKSSFKNLFNPIIYSSNSKYHLTIDNTKFSFILNSAILLSRGCDNYFWGNDHKYTQKPYKNVNVSIDDVGKNEERGDKRAFINCGNNETLGDVIIIACIFTDCIAADNKGGALSIEQNSEVHINETIFIRCSTAKKGGALYIVKSTDDKNYDLCNEVPLIKCDLQYNCFQDCFTYHKDSERKNTYGVALFSSAENITILYNSAVNCSDIDDFKADGAQFDLRAGHLIAKFMNLTGGKSYSCGGVHIRKATNALLQYHTMTSVKSKWVTEFSIDSSIQIDGFTLQYCNYISNEVGNSSDSDNDGALIYINQIQFDIALENFYFLSNAYKKESNKIIQKSGSYSLKLVKCYIDVFDMNRFDNNYKTDSCVFNNKEFTKYQIDQLKLGGCDGQKTPGIDLMTLEFTFTQAFSKSELFSDSKYFSSSEKFSETNKFTKSNLFSNSEQFTRSTYFTNSDKFTKSEYFSYSKQFSKSIFFSNSEKFSGSIYFTNSEKFSKSNAFSNSDKFSKSSDFLNTNQFSESYFFSNSEKFSNSAFFSNTKQFSGSTFFSNSIDFSKSSCFTNSGHFSESHYFSNSEEFSKTTFFSNSEEFSKTTFFSNSEKFSESNIFSNTEMFSESSYFLNTKQFSESHYFSNSGHFSESNFFSSSEQFSESNFFSNSQIFLKTSYFLNTKHFSKSNYFSSSGKFSKSACFLDSKQFSKSNFFSKSEEFSRSTNFLSSRHFSKSNFFSSTGKFSKSACFSNSKQFSKSNFFSKSEEFAGTKNFLNSMQFSKSNFFSSSDEFSKSAYFLDSMMFSKSNFFSGSDDFSKSAYFLNTKQFSKSNFFSNSEQYSNSPKFSTSFLFSCSNRFSSSKYFSFSYYFSDSSQFYETIESLIIENHHSMSSFHFTKSDCFSVSSHFQNTKHFSLSSEFSRSDSFTSSNFFSESNIFSESLVLNVSETEVIINNIAKKNSKTKTGMIIGIVVGIIVLLCIILLILFFVNRKKNTENQEVQNALDTQETNSLVVYTNPIYTDDNNPSDPFLEDFDEIV